TMADLNIPANITPAEQAPAVAPPTRTDDQIIPSSKWVPIGKSNSVLDVLKSQRNPIFSIAMAILKNTNFFRAFTTSSTIPAIYIQQFWDTMCFNSSTGLYSCQLDEKCFNLHKDILRDALDITPANDNNPFGAPPLSDIVTEYVNTLRYPNTLKNVSAMSVNALYQPWRAIMSMINMCLTGKTAGFDRPRHPTLQILWGITHHSNIDYAEQIWEEFVQSLQTFLTDRKNLATEACRKKKTLHLLIPNVRFTKLIIHHLRTNHNIHPRTGSPLHYSHEESILNTLRFVGKDRREVFGMPIPDALLTDEIKSAPYYSRYVEHVVEYQRCLDDENDKAEEEDVTESPKSAKATKSKTAKQTKPSTPKASKLTKPPKPTTTTTEPSKKDQTGKVTKQRKPKIPLQLVDKFVDEGVPEQEPIYGDEEADIQQIQPLPDVQGNGKEKEASPEINAGTPDEGQAGPNLGEQVEGQAGPNLGIQDEGQAGSNPGDAAESQPQLSHAVHARPNIEHMDFEAPLEPFNGHSSYSLGYLLSSSNDHSGYRSHNVTTCLHNGSSTTTNINNNCELEQHMADLLQDNLALGERLDKHGTRLYNLEKLDIPHKEILQQQMFEDDSYKANNVHKDLYKAMQKSLELDYSNQCLTDQEEARKKRRKRRDIPRTPHGSPLSQPPPPPPPAGTSGAPSTSGASRSSQLSPPPPPPSSGTSGSTPQQGYEVPSSSKTIASAQQSMAWTTYDTRYESTGIAGAQDSSPIESLMHDDSTPDEQVQLSDDEDTENDQIPEADIRKDWWKPLPEEERPMNPEPAWTVLLSIVSDTGDMTTFLNWYCRQINKSKLTQANLEGQAYEVVKVFYPDIIHLQFQMEECHKMLTDQVDWANPEGDQVRINVKRPLPLGGPPGHVTIQTEFFFNKDLEYLRFSNKGSMLVLSISKMKAARYPDFGLELLVPQDEDFQLRIESYQTQLNLTKPGWDAIGYKFKHDYTIIGSPRAIIFPVNNNE
ncbi:hypothetical protein Tco_1223597, partial [Tanacetum coccineum]